MGGFLQRLAQAVITRTNAQSGVTAQAQAAQAASEGGLLRRAQAAHLFSQIPSPAEEAAKLDLMRAQAGMMRSHGQAYATPKTALRVVNGDLWDMSDPSSPRKVISGATNPGYAMTTNENNDVVFIPKPGTGGPRSSVVTPSVQPGIASAIGQATPQPAATASPVTPGATPADGVINTGVKKTPKAPRLVAGTDATTGEPTWGTPGAPGFLPPMTQVERTRRDQASHVISQGAALIAELNKPEVQAIMGPRQGLVTGFKDTAIGGAITGGAPPEAAHLASALSSLSAFLPIMHGMRGGDNMIVHFERQMGKQGELAIRRTPEAVQAAVGALVEAAKRIREHGDRADLTDLAPTLGTPAGPGVGRSAAPTPASGIDAIKQKHGITY